VEITREASKFFDFARQMRRDFHRHPELGFQEVRTAGIVARELNALGLEVTTGVAKTGVVGLLAGKHPGPVVLLRFDMDALPIQEQTGAEYASQAPGVMHACGHDGHTAIGLTVARILAARRDELRGVVKFVFQPAEEGLGGAEQMVAEGVLQSPRPDFVLGLHLWNEKPVGWLGISPGPVMAAAEKFTVRIYGKGGHGALPHQAIDPVLAAAQTITALQSIPSREVSPLASAVVSVTTIHGGDAFNVIPPEVEMRGTLRTFEPEVRAKVLERFEQITTKVVEGMGCRVDIRIQSITPAVINDQELTRRVAATARRVAPHLQQESAHRTMGSEDMAFFMQDIAGCFIFVGSANAEKGLDALHHHPRFDFDERALFEGAALISAAALDLMRSATDTDVP